LFYYFFRTLLESIWEQVSAITGPYQRTLDTKTNVVNNVMYYIVHAQCKSAFVNLALAYDGTNRVSFILLTPLSSLPKSEIEHRAVQVAAEFFQQRFDDIFSRFDVSLKNQLTANQLRSFFTQVTNASGNFDHVVGGVKNRDLDVVNVLCQLEGGKAIVRIAYGPDMEINGFMIVPGK
jgi:hypothetical protein